MVLCDCKITVSAKMSLVDLRRTKPAVSGQTLGSDSRAKRSVFTGILSILLPDALNDNLSLDCKKQTL